MKSINIYKSILMALLLCGLFSCKKDTKLSKEGLFVYAESGNVAFNVTNGSDIVALRQKIVSGKDAKLAVLITRAYTQDVQVTAKIDTGLVKTYNKDHNAAAPKLPEGAFTLVNNGTVTIKAGETAASDSVQVRFSDASLIKAGTNTYVVPVVLSMTSGGIPVSSTRQTMYVKIAVTSIAVGINSASGSNVVDILLNNVNGVNTGIDLVNLRAGLNKALDQNVTVTVEENAAAIAEFNTRNGSNYKPFPSGAFQFLKKDVEIVTKSITSTEDIQVKLPDLSLFTAGVDYLLAVKIKENTSVDSPPANESKNIVYIHVSVFVNNVDPANPALTGTTIPRTGWTVTASSSYSTNGVSRVLDGNNATAWDSDSGLPQWIQLDMGAMETVKGFPIVPSYEYKNDNFINMDVLSSNDGIVWKLQGKYVGTTTGGTADDPDIKTVKFVTPVTARYFKFSITNSTDGSYAGMAELNAIK